MASDEDRKEKKRLYQRAYAAANREKTRQATRNWRAANPDKIAAYELKYRPERAAAARKKYQEDPQKFRAKTRAWYASHREQAIACVRACSAKNAEARRAYRKQYYAKFRERLLAATAQWRALNPVKFRDGKASWIGRNSARVKAYSEAYHAAHKVKANRNSKLWRATNPEAKRALDHARRARLRSAEGRYRTEDVRRIFAAQKGRCAYCKTSIKSAYDVDHITPISRGGSNWPRNIQLTCEPCNQRKHAADPIEFAQKIGLLV